MKISLPDIQEIISTGYLDHNRYWHTGIYKNIPISIRLLNRNPLPNESLLTIKGCSVIFKYRQGGIIQAGCKKFPIDHWREHGDKISEEEPTGPDCFYQDFKDLMEYINEVGIQNEKRLMG